MQPLQVAVLDEELPFPPTSGKRIRTWNLLKRMADRHRVTVICHRNADAGEAERAEAEFRRLGVETVVVDRKVPKKAGPAFYARLAGNLLSPLPYSVESHASRALARAVRRLERERRFDCWHCEWTPYAEVLNAGLGKRLARVPWVVMAHNVESQIWQRYTDAEPNPVKKWYTRTQWTKYESFEQWAYSHATRVVAVSNSDAQQIADRFGVDEVDVVDNGVDVGYFAPRRDVERDPNRILFLGSLDWRPNQDAVRTLLDVLLPRVRAAVPSATVSLVGRNPPGWLAHRVNEMAGVDMFADVPDVRPFLHTCGVMAVPLRVGGGSRLKILEALATATPVVSSRVGAEGLHLVPGRHLTVGIEPSHMADGLIDAILRPEEAKDQAEEGRRLVAQRYDWDTLADRLDETWRAAANERVPAAVEDGGGDL
jgi:glycosyltransferase involved in cell wall biosynthesis